MVHYHVTLLLNKLGKECGNIGGKEWQIDMGASPQATCKNKIVNLFSSFLALLQESKTK
jgi:hypothetical protein